MSYQSSNKYYIISNLHDYKVFTSYKDAEIYILDRADYYEVDFNDVSDWLLDNIESVRFDELTQQQKDYICGDRG